MSQNGQFEEEFIPRCSVSQVYAKRRRNLGHPAIAGPVNGKDNWAGPNGMGPPTGTGDWRAAVHNYNFSTNGITIGSYFNSHLSLEQSRALIQSNNNLMRTGGVQGAKEKMVFGVINAFQWYANSWK